MRFSQLPSTPQDGLLPNVVESNFGERNAKDAEIETVSSQTCCNGETSCISRQRLEAKPAAGL